MTADPSPQPRTPPDEKVVYLMRGLPSCGKSHTAKKLAGPTGVVCETDEYFYTRVGSDPATFDYRDDLLDEARRWNFERFKRAVDAGVSPVVVDRGNSLSVESREYARYAVDRGYRVELQEPDAEWWQEIRVLLKYRKYTQPVLYEWAERLARLSRKTHRVPAGLIRRWMEKWRWDLTVEDILHYRDPAESPAASTPSRTNAVNPRSSAPVASNEVHGAGPSASRPRRAPR